MDTNKIKDALIKALALLTREVETEIIQETKVEYRNVIAKIESALKELQ